MKTIITNSLLCLLIALSGCAPKAILRPIDSEKNTWNSSRGKPVWFKSAERFALKDTQGAYKHHHFFDFAPLINFKEKSLNFVVTTPAYSPVAYKLDIVSGSRFGVHSFCPQKDVWNSYDGILRSPPYTEGVVPRVLDQLGKPQIIRVFGREQYYKDNLNNLSHRVRVVGAVLEQHCEKPPCYGNDSWDSRMILLAVDPNDHRLKEVKNFSGLKKSIKWKYVKAFMENAGGRNVLSNKDVPSFRIVGDIKPGFALQFATNYSYVFKGKELNQIRRSCFKLYDHLWEKIGKPYYGRDLSTKEARDFTRSFKKFHSKFGDKFTTCSDFVVSSNINDNTKRHWFFSYIEGFFKLQRLGYYYECSPRRWVKNPFEYYQKRLYSPTKELQKCTAQEFNEAFPKAIKAMIRLKNLGKEHYRYVDYDNHRYGTHEKIYSWVRDRPRQFRCLDKSKEWTTNQLDLSIFPSDIQWPNMIDSRKMTKDRFIR